jgi:hypothetical protein
MLKVILSKILSRNPSERPSCNEILETKNLWLNEIKDINYVPLLYSIAVNGDNIDRSAMNPLSHHILNRKLVISKERELEWICKHGLTSKMDNCDVRLIFHSMESYQKISDAILSNKLIVESNVNEQLMYQLIGVIKHAFIVHLAYHLISEFISINVQKINPSGMWKCLFYQPTQNDGLKSNAIHWHNTKYMHAYLPSEHCSLRFSKNMTLLIYNTLKSVQLTNDDSNEISIIINKYDSVTTDSLLEFINETQLIHLVQNSDDPDFEFAFPKVYTSNLRKLRAMISDERAFYYLSKNKEFLLYNEEINNNSRFTVSLNCKFAATIGELNFAVFTYQSAQSKLQLSLYRNNSDVSEIQIFDGNLPLLKYSTLI